MEGSAKTFQAGLSAAEVIDVAIFGFGQTMTLRATDFLWRSRKLAAWGPNSMTERADTTIERLNIHVVKGCLGSSKAGQRSE